MRLCILTPARAVVDLEVTELYAPGVVGQLGVLRDHVTFLGALDSGEVRYRTAKDTHLLLMSGGVVEVVDNKVTVLADEAIAPEEVDGGRAREELAAAEEAVSRLDPFSSEYTAAESRRQWALVKVRAAERAQPRS